MFTDKVVLITGASEGIGAQTAFDFAKLNAKLVLTARNKQNLEKVAVKCEEISPLKLKPLVIAGDVNNEADIENVIKGTIEFHSRLDVLVNNAGISDSGTIETTTLDQFDRMMRVNVRGPFYMTMLATPHLIKSKGNIVNVSSVAGLRSFPNLLTYCLSKSALDQFTRCIAIELGPKGVRVNSVNPGAILTGIHLKSMTEDEYRDYLERCKTTHLVGRPGKPKRCHLL